MAIIACLSKIQKNYSFSDQEIFHLRKKLFLSKEDKISLQIGSIQISKTSTKIIHIKVNLVYKILKLIRSLKLFRYIHSEYYLQNNNTGAIPNTSFTKHPRATGST